MKRKPTPARCKRALSVADRKRRQRRQWAANNPIKVMLKDARRRALRDRVAFKLTEDDIVMPTHCPVLGIALRKNRGRAGDSSPSLDRIVPRRGYVPGNVAVISQRANVIKTNATALELYAVAKYVAQNG